MHNFELNYQLSEISFFAAKILSLNKKVILFDGEVGSGKTTLIKELCKILGSTSQFSSPTFQIVNEYVYPHGLIYHFDLYRLKNVADLGNLAFDDYLFSGNYCFIEWPQLLENIVTNDFVRIKLTSNNTYRNALIEITD